MLAYAGINWRKCPLVSLPLNRLNQCKPLYDGQVGFIFSTHKSKTIKLLVSLQFLDQAQADACARWGVLHQIFGVFKRANNVIGIC